MTPDAALEALLFYKAEPMSLISLQKLLELDEESLKSTISTLQEKLQGRGIVLIEENDSVELRTSPQASSLIATFSSDEESKELSKPALETLSVILYKGPLNRRDIDFIRGVNSSFILRTLTSRGLIKKSASLKDAYEPTIELLSHLGVSHVSELPEYESTKETLETRVQDLVQTGNE